MNSPHLGVLFVFVNATRFVALRAAADRGIPAAFDAEHAGQTRLRVGAQHLEKVREWWTNDTAQPRCMGYSEEYVVYRTRQIHGPK